MDFGLEDLVGSVFPVRRDFIEIDTHRLVHEWKDPVNSLFSESTVLPETHNYQPLIGLHYPDPEQ
jgi:hypothetical protein